MKKSSLIASFVMAAGFFFSGDAKSQDTIYVDETKKSMSQLRRDFARSSVGRDLLDFADNNGILMRYDKGWMSKKNNAEYDDRKNLVTIGSDLTRSEALIYLAHEIYHGWQEKYVGYPRLERDVLMPPHWSFALMQHCEGSAAAFSAYYWANREFELGPDSSPYASARAERTTAKNLLAEMQGDGLSIDEYRRLAIEPMMADLYNYPYPHKHLNTAARPLASLESSLSAWEFDYSFGTLGGWLMLPREIRAKFEAAPDSATFDATLRKMGGMTLDPEAPTALSDTSKVSGHKLFHEYPALHMVPDTAAAGPALKADTKPPERLADLTQRYNAAVATFNGTDPASGNHLPFGKIRLQNLLFWR